MRKKHIKEVLIFFIVTLFLSLFVFWGPIAFYKIPAIGFNNGKQGPVWAITLFIIGGFIPSLTGIILTVLFEGRKQAKRLLMEAFHFKIGLKWFVAISLFALYFAAAWIIIYSASGGHFDYSRFFTMLPTFVPLLMLGPLSEEYGWRGFALKRLIRVVNPNIASLIIGLVWSMWHLPLFYMAGTNQYEHNLSFASFLVSVTCSSFIYTYIYIKTNQNLFTAVFFHWLCTFLSDVVLGGVVRSDLFSSLEFMPGLLIGLVFAYIMHKEKISQNRSHGLNT